MYIPIQNNNKFTMCYVITNKIIGMTIDNKQFILQYILC